VEFRILSSLEGISYMEELKELVKIVTNRGQKNISLLDLNEKKLSKEMELFFGIQKGLYANDEQAAAQMYDSTPDDAKYKMLKSRLRKKLLNHLFFLDFSGSRFKISHKYEQECLNLLHQSRMLIAKQTFEGFYGSRIYLHNYFLSGIFINCIYTEWQTLPFL
jgi:hypothetical protein